MKRYSASPLGPASTVRQKLHPPACFLTIGFVLLASASRTYDRKRSKSGIRAGITWWKIMPADAVNDRDGSVAGGTGAGQVTVPGTGVVAATAAGGAAGVCAAPPGGDGAGGTTGGT